jgi:hypothetical protein
MTDAVGAEPLAVWDGCQGRREARVMIWFIALRAEMSTATSGGVEIKDINRIPCHTRAGRRHLCGIPDTRLACLVRQDGVADQSTSRSG